MKNCQQREEPRLKVLSLSSLEDLFLLLILISLSHSTVAVEFGRNFSPSLKPFSENLTVVLPTLFNGTQNSTSNATFHKSVDFYDKYPWFCQYTSDMEEDGSESACYCEGKRLTKIPQILPPHITKLTIANAHIQVLKENALKVYAATLKDL